LGTPYNVRTPFGTIGRKARDTSQPEVHLKFISSSSDLLTTISKVGNKHSEIAPGAENPARFKLSLYSPP
jgi:hypothetical protein